MGIYNRYLEGTALDSVQDPDNPGVDLDQIEKDIVGDGNEAHSEEIEDAVEGVIDDPIEEAYMIMYESEHNYNMLLRVIGIKELHEATMGREFILEAVDIKGFFKRIKDIIVSMFKRITSAFKNVINKIKSTFMDDKKFVTKYEKQILDGGEKIDRNTDIKIYPFGEIKMIGGEDSGKDWAGLCQSCINDAKAGKFSADSLGDIEEYKADILSGIGGVKVSNVSELAEELTKKTFGEKVSLFGASGNSIKTFVAILKGDNEAKEIQKAYDIIKKSYKSALNDIDKMEKAALDGEKSELAKTHVTQISNFFSQLIKFEQNVQNVRYTVMVKAARAKRSQARKIANMCLKASGKNISAKDENALIKNSGLFSNMSFI